MKRSIAFASVFAALQMFAGAARAESPEAAQAREQLEPYRKLPTFQAPGEAFDAAACMKGKSILSIPGLQRRAFHQDDSDRRCRRSPRRSAST